MKIYYPAVAVAVFVFSAFAVSSEKAAKQPTSSPLVGADSCKSCHPSSYETWEKGPHSKAAANLDEDTMKSGNCGRCHATGLGLPGGYVHGGATPGMRHVQCEACHGGGTVHIAAAGDNKKRSISVNGVDCRLCHKPHKAHSGD